MGRIAAVRSDILTTVSGTAHKDRIAMSKSCMLAALMVTLVCGAWSGVGIQQSKAAEDLSTAAKPTDSSRPSPHDPRTKPSADSDVDML